MLHAFPIQNKRVKNMAKLSSKINTAASLLAASIWMLGGATSAQAQDICAPVLEHQPIEYPQTDECYTFKQTELRPLQLHVFRPDGDVSDELLPAVVFVFGGGWIMGTPEAFFDQAAHFASLGLVSISIDYRTLNQDGTAPDVALSDTLSAMRFIRSNAEMLGIDANRIALGGGSAGGHLAAAVVTTEGFDDPADDLSVDPRPNALILFNPVVDNSPTGFGFDRGISEFWEQFSPLHNVGPVHPPTVFMLGTQDNLIPVSTGEAYCDAVRATGSICTLHLYDGAGHGFFNRFNSQAFYEQTLSDAQSFVQGLGYVFAPEPNKVYHIDNPAHGLRLAARSGSEVLESAALSSTGENTQWRFVQSATSGLWHIQRAAGGNTPRIRTVLSTTPDMQATSSSGDWTRFSIEANASRPGTYLLTVPLANTVNQRLRLLANGTTDFSTNNNVGNNPSFVFTEVN